MRIPPVRPEFSAEDRAEILQRIDLGLQNGQIAQGENLREFEQAFASYTGARHTVAVSSGGAALEIGMNLLNVAGQEVLVPTNTFAATAMAVLRAGGRIRFVDADAGTFAISIDTLEAACTPATRGVILVHIGGIITPSIEAIREWCDRRGYWLFEDAAHAHGSSWNGKMAGCFGRAAAYSFFATKVITSGEGGMFVTNDEKLAAGARALRDYGKTDAWVSFHTTLGANWRMPEFCAAVGAVQLRRLDEFIRKREVIAAIYSQELAAVPTARPVSPPGRSSLYKFIVLLDPGVDREAIRAAMKTAGIGLSGGVYDIPLHRQPVFQETAGTFPVADDICNRHICLPLYAGMTEEEARYVVRSLKSALAASPAQLSVS